MWPQALSLDAALLRFPLPSELWHVSTGGADTTVSLHTVGITPACDTPVIVSVLTDC